MPANRWYLTVARLNLRWLSIRISWAVHGIRGAARQRRARFRCEATGRWPRVAPVRKRVGGSRALAREEFEGSGGMFRQATHRPLPADGSAAGGAMAPSRRPTRKPVGARD